MATFSGGTSPAALAALAPSINNLAAARNARSQSISGLMNTIGAGFERNKKQKQVKEKNEIAMGVAKGLLNDPNFQKSMPGITDAASLVKLTGADEIIKFGREQQQINLVTKESEANIGLINTRVKEFERQKEDREAAKESAKALQVLLPPAISLEAGGDATAIFEDPNVAKLTPTDYITLANTISSRTGLDAQVVSENLKSQKALTGATIEEIASGELASQAIAGVVSGKIKSLDEVTNFGEMTVDQQGKVISVWKEQNPTAPTPMPMLNPDGSGEILGYALDTGRGFQIIESAKSGGGLGRTAQDAANALKLRLDAGEISQEKYQEGMATIRTQASFVTDPDTGLLVDPTASDDGPDADVPISDLNSELSIGIAKRLSGLTNIISEKGEINMQELDKALSMLKSSAGLDDSNISEIMRMLNDTASDRKAADDQRERMEDIDKSMVSIEMGPERVAKNEEILRRVSRGPSLSVPIGF